MAQHVDTGCSRHQAASRGSRHVTSSHRPCCCCCCRCCCCCASGLDARRGYFCRSQRSPPPAGRSRRPPAAAPPSDRPAHSGHSAHFRVVPPRRRGVVALSSPCRRPRRAVAANVSAAGPLSAVQSAVVLAHAACPLLDALFPCAPVPCSAPGPLTLALADTAQRRRRRRRRCLEPRNLLAAAAEQSGPSRLGPPPNWPTHHPP